MNVRQMLDAHTCSAEIQSSSACAIESVGIAAEPDPANLAGIWSINLPMIAVS
jgi:hypothetical protein